MLREDIERRIQDATHESIYNPDKLVCYFAHDSTLASFYYAFELDKIYSEQLINASFCSYFVIECVISQEEDTDREKTGDRKVENVSKLSS